MKIVLLFFILLNVHAQTDSKQREVFRQALRKARKLNLEGNYAQSNEYLEKIFKYKDRKINTPSVVLILVVDNYEKRGKYLSAIKYLNYYINRDYKVKHERILKAFEEDRLYPYAKAPNKLQKAYEKKSEIFTKMYLVAVKDKVKSQYNLLKGKSDFYFKLCQKFPTNKCTKTTQLVAKTQDIRRSRDSENYRKTSFTSMGFMLFSEDLNLKNRTLSVNHFIKTINQVAYIGRGWKKANAMYTYSFGASLFGGFSNVNEDSATPSPANYTQSGVLTYGVLGDISFSGRFFKQDWPIGIGVQLKYKVADYEDVTNAGNLYQVEEKKAFSLGPYLQLAYEKADKDYIGRIGVLDDSSEFYILIQVNTNSF